MRALIPYSPSAALRSSIVRVVLVLSCRFKAINDMLRVRTSTFGLPWRTRGLKVAGWFVHDHQWHLCVYEHVGKHQQRCPRRIFGPPATGVVFCTIASIGQTVDMQEISTIRWMGYKYDSQTNIFAIKSNSLQVVISHLVRNLPYTPSG